MNPKKIGVAALTTLLTLTPVLATLDTFPEPFVSDGVLDDTRVVVGENAATADVVGAINVAAALAQDATSSAAGAGSVVLETTSTTVSEGKRVEAAGEDLNYEEDFYDVLPSHKLTSSDLDILADKTFTESEGETTNSEDYTQELSFSNGADIVKFTKEDDDPEKRTTYLFLDKSQDYTYTYTLEFDDKAEYDNSSSSKVKNDFLTTELEILGDTYTVVTAKNQDSAPYLYYMELMSGSSKDTLDEGETETYTVSGTDYEVTLDIVTSDAATFTVDGESTTGISEGGTYELSDGTEIGVTDIVYQGWAGGSRRVEFYVGAEKVTLEDGKEVDIGGTSVDGSDVQFTSGTDGEWTKLVIRHTVDDDVYLEAGEEWEDPIFGNFKFVFTGLDKTTEEIEGSASGSTGELVFTNNAGDEVEIPLKEDDTDVYPGDEQVASTTTVSVDGNTATRWGNMLVANGDFCNDTSDITNCEDIYLLAVSSGGEVRVLEITDIDTSDDQVDIKDHTAGATWDNKDYTDGSATTISLGGFMSISLNVDETNKNVTASTINSFSGQGTNGEMETSLAGELGLVFDGDDTFFYLYQKNGTDLARFRFDLDSSSDMEIDDIADTSGSSLTGGAKEEDADIYKYIDQANYGAIITWDQDNKDDITIEFPEEEVIAEAYVSPTGAVTSTEEVTKEVGDSVNGYTVKEITAEAGVTVNEIPSVGIAMLDTEASAVKDQYNLILVGGGAINSLVDELESELDHASVANMRAEGSGYSAIELVEDAFASGKDVLVVAGYEAEETQAATYVLQNYEDYSDQFTGSAVEITGTKTTVTDVEAATAE